MANHEWKINALEFHAKAKTIFDRVNERGDSFSNELDKVAKDNTYLAFLIGYQAGKTEISRNVLEWIKEGA